jgi:flagellar hook-basal body complex protein FliE
VTAPIGPTGPVVSPIERQDIGPQGIDRGPSFGDVLGRALTDASDLQDDAQRIIGAFLRGEPVELHQVMAASEEAAISLELLVEVRNKLADAYRTVMNIQ